MILIQDGGWEKNEDASGVRGKISHLGERRERDFLVLLCPEMPHFHWHRPNPCRNVGKTIWNVALANILGVPNQTRTNLWIHLNG